MRRKKIYKALAFCLSTVMLAQPVFATTVQQTAQGSLGSVTEESQILPIPGESGKYILKSNGFYCLNEDGTKENTPAVYYFDHFEIDGTVFDGYYYHDESGKFTAGNSHMVQITDLKAPAKDGSGEEALLHRYVIWMSWWWTKQHTTGCIILMNMEKWLQIQVSIIWK